MKLIIDRFEGDWAVIEYNNSTFNLPKDLLPEGVKEGLVIDIKVEINKAATEERKESIPVNKQKWTLAKKEYSPTMTHRVDR
jgi:hypothetical protein